MYHLSAVYFLNAGATDVFLLNAGVTGVYHLKAEITGVFLSAEVTDVCHHALHSHT